MRPDDTRSGAESRLSRSPARVTYLPGREGSRRAWQGNTSRLDEADSPPAGRPRLLDFAQLTTFGALAWALGALIATLGGMWSSSPVPVLATALLLMVPAALIGAALVLRGLRGPEEEPEERGAAEVRDTTTGLPGQSYFQVRLEEEIDRARRYERSLAVVIIDVNHLQSVNEQYDWSCGDQVLKHLARVIEGTKRGSDVLARLNDDRYGLLLPECSEEGAGSFIRRLEERLAREPARAHFGSQIITLWVGVCAGVATLSAEAGGPSEVLSLAEADLRVAKEHLKRRRQRWLSA